MRDLVYIMLSRVVALSVLCVLVVPWSLAHAEEHIVKTIDYKFVPDEITIKVGDTVRWVNKEKRQYHSVWFKEEGMEPGEYFWPGEGDQRTFNAPGDYPYVCEPHESRGMTGVVHVVE